MANSNNTPSASLVSLDFDTNLATMKNYLKSQQRFQDYNFDGPNITVFLEILARNTFLQSYYLNMVGNEMWMDTALLRDSVVSHAKDLNYTPRSFTSATANVNITIVSADSTKRSIVVPKGTTFTSPFGTKNYTFTTSDNILISDYTINSNGTVTFLGENLTIYEGYYVSDTFVYNSANNTQFVLSNENVDTSSLAVTVVEDSGSAVSTFTQAYSLFDLNASSKVFFVEGAPSDSYQITFGDGVSGRQPKDNSTIVAEYRISNGELPNGCNTFVTDSTIDGEANITVTVNSAASSGSVSETIDSIKFNAPRHFTTQERAVTTEDYENLLKINYPEINAVTAYGGEDLDPPQFGKVYVAVDLVDVDGLPQIKKDEYYNFLVTRNPTSIDPVFVDSDYTYIAVESTIKYNINTTKLTSNDIETIATSAITDYAANNLNNYATTFYYSKMCAAIDASQASIISNDTKASIIKIITPTAGSYQTFDVNFGVALDTTTTTAYGYTLTSSQFVYQGQKAVLEDLNGVIAVLSATTGNLIDTVGTITYTSGLLQFSNFKIDSYYNSGIKLYVVPSAKDISTTNNVILNILEEDINLTIVPTRA